MSSSPIANPNSVSGLESVRRILVIAGPLILASLGGMLMQFVDAVVLSHSSREAIAAVGPASMLFFSVLGLVLGITSYAGTFVAHYIGAKQFQRVGPSVWQAVYISLLASIPIMCLSLAGRPIFNLFNHGPKVAELEAIYFSISCLGVPLFLLSSSVSSFFAGRGDNLILMTVQLFGALVNLGLCIAMVFGKLGLPAMGMAGAAWATVTSQGIVFLILLLLFLSKKHRDQYATWTGRSVDLRLLSRMLTFGFPSGVRFFVEVLSWTMFVVFIGRIGPQELAATNIVLRINMLAFIPIIGLSTATSILVGQAQGAKRPAEAQSVIWYSLAIGEVWMIACGILFVLLPRTMVSLFHDAQDAGDFAPIIDYCTVLLRFVAVYCLVDTFNVVLTGSLQGAGDTRWSLGATLVAYTIFFAGLWTVSCFQGGIYMIWTWATIFVFGFACMWFVRFRSGHWKKIDVIEQASGEDPLSTIV